MATTIRPLTEPASWDYIHVTDLAVAHLSALQYFEKGGDSVVLNCGYGSGYSVREILAVTEKVCGTSLNLAIVDRRPGDIERLVADNRKILELLDWTPRHDRIELVRRKNISDMVKIHRSLGML